MRQAVSNPLLRVADLALCGGGWWWAGGGVASTTPTKSNTTVSPPPPRLWQAQLYARGNNCFENTENSTSHARTFILSSLVLTVAPVKLNPLWGPAPLVSPQYCLTGLVGETLD
jgi:hypothetical protein